MPPYSHIADNELSELRGISAFIYFSVLVRDSESEILRGEASLSATPRKF